MLFGGRVYGGFLALTLLMASLCAATAITQTYGVFDVTFYNAGDSDGSTTGQQDWTSQQMADVQASINTWQNRISNVPGRQVQMHLFWTEMDSYGTSVHGGSSSYRVGNGSQVWNLGEYVWKEGSNPGFSGGGWDTVIEYDITAAGLNWNFGTDAPLSNDIDFRSVITHEIGHSLGWDTTFSNTRDDWGWMYTNYPYGNYYGLTAWDDNLIDGAGSRANNGGTGTPGNFIQNDNPVYFDGANAVALYGDLVPVYAPSTFRTGSSLAHLDESALGGLLMSPFVGRGQTIRTVSELEWAMMQDMGWNIIPEPSTILLVCSAIGLIRVKNKK